MKHQYRLTIFHAGNVAWSLAFTFATTSALAGPPPPGTLPVPCLSGACGPAVTSFSGGAATATQVGNKLTVNQTTANALLNWKSFDIASGSTVNFVQPSSSSLAVNKIFQGSPSQIFGTLTANGRVYLINQNGIMFGSGSQVNTAGLVASSLNISENALANGIALALQRGAVDQTDPSFVNFLDTNGNALPSGSITIAKGATLNATGGQIYVFAPQISNQGKITTPDGQTILAAGNAIYLAASTDPNVRGLVVAVDSAPVGGSVASAGIPTVTNGSTDNAGVTDPNQLTGQIIAPHGNVTLMGLAVNQLGMISADTAVRANGTIRLVAGDRTQAGTLNLGANSITAAGIDTTDTALAVDATVQQKSTVSLQGLDVNLAGGSKVIATSGAVTITGSDAGVLGSNDPIVAPTTTTGTSGNVNTSRIYIADGASIDVSGATATLPMSSNVLEVELRGSELADEPVQRNGALRGATVTVDVRQYGTLADGTSWQGTPLANLSGDIATIQRGVAQRNETGGSVTLQSLGDVIVGKADINVSGGSSIYQSGYINTSSVIGLNGQLTSITNADPNVVYKGVSSNTTLSLSDQRWGVTTQYNGIYYGNGQGQYQAGYVQGADAGSLHLNAPHLIFDGTLEANVQAGPFQRKAPTTLAAGVLQRPYDQLPMPGLLEVRPDVTNYPDLSNPSPATLFNNPFTASNLILPSITLGPVEALATVKNADGSPFDPLNDPWPEALTTFTLNPALIGTNAAGRVVLMANEAISLPHGVDLQLPAGGSFVALSSNIDVGGSITGPGASIALLSAPTVQITSTYSGGVTLESTAALNVAGSWVNENPAITPSPSTAPLLLNGGNVTLAARDGDVALHSGALIDVSGGARLSPTGAFTAGTAGSIAVASNSPDYGLPTELTLGATLRGYGVTNGGQLSLTGAAFCLTAGAVCADPAATGTITLAPSFFTTGGFGSYSLTANKGALEVTSHTQIHPEQQNLLNDVSLATKASATTFDSIASVGSLPDVQRKPVNLSLATQYTLPIDQNTQTPVYLTSDTFAQAPGLSLDSGASILLDPLGTLSLRSNTRIADDALIRLPAGTVSMTVSNQLAEPTFIDGHQLWLGPHATVDVSGAVQAQVDDQGRLIGSVLSGGSVNLTAQRGAVVTSPGSLIDVSGTAASLSLPRTDSNGAISYQTTAVASAGGSVAIVAPESALLNGAMRANSGDPAKLASGSFSLTLDGNDRYANYNFQGFTPPYPYDPRVIELAQTQAPTVVAAGAPLPNSVEGRALLSADMLTAADFGAVTLRSVTLDPTIAPATPSVSGIIEFTGNVALNLNRSLILDAGGFQSNGGKAVLSAPYVSIAQTRLTTQSTVGATMTGTGTLQVNAAELDLLGHTAFGGFATVALNSTGNIQASGLYEDGFTLLPQFAGALSVSGDLQLTAQQIFPSTLTNFAITAGAGGTGDITIAQAAGTQPSSAVLSAGGSLSFIAQNITQGGTVRAPLGNITFNAPNITLADGSMTSTSAAGQTIPFGQTQGGFDWAYPYPSGGTTALIYGVNGLAPPSQSIALTGAAINVAKGATVDVRGGGDLLATEFIGGPTGTKDVLGTPYVPGASGVSGAFAILPTSSLSFAPIDTYYDSTAGALAPGSSVYLSGGNGLPAGTYTVLPARYALLPGAYYVTPVAGYQDLTPGQQLVQTDGSVIVSGRNMFAGTAFGDARTSGFDVRPGTAVQNLAQYTLTSANAFFSAQAKSAAEQSNTAVVVPRLPVDAGSISLGASTQLTLNASIEAAPGTGGRGAQVDISSAAIRVVDGTAATPEAGVLDLNADSLSALGVESVLIGGTRTQTSTGTQINTQASTVEVTSGATLSGPELLLAATNSVTVDAGATVTASGSLPIPDSALLLSGDGGLLRVAVGGNPLVARSGTTGTQGQVSLLAGSVINAPKGSLGIDASSSATIEGTLNLPAGTLAISGTQISVGEVPAGTTGIALPAAVLNGTSLSTLSISSSGAIDFYDGSSISAQNISLSAGSLRGFGTTGAQVTASDMLSLSGTANSSGLAGTGTGIGTLALQGGSVTLLSGILDTSGFAATDITTPGQLTVSGKGSLNVTGDLNMSAGLLTAASGAVRGITSTGAFSYEAATNAARLKPPSEMPLGASIAISAPTLSFDGSAQLHAGALTLYATGDHGDVSLGDSANIDLGAVNTNFDSVVVASRAGVLTLQSDHGSVIASANSQVNVGALDDSVGNAGALIARAANGTVSLAGHLSGRSADVTADGQSLGNTGTLLAALGGGGFSGIWDLRLRGPGDLTVAGDAAQTITGRSVSLTADQGGIDIEGIIRSSASPGGSIVLSAAKDVTVNGTLDARPTASGQMNGQIELSTTQGRVVVGSTSTIEAYQAGTAVQSNADGGLWIRAPRSAVVSVSAVDSANAGIVLAGDLHGLRAITLEGFQSYANTTGTLSAADVTAGAGNAMYTDAQAFMANVATAPAVLQALATVKGPTATIVPGIEIDSNQSLTLQSDWSLDTWHFSGVGGAPVAGAITLRSAGDLNFLGSLSDGFTGTTGPAAFKLTSTDPSWSYRLAGGADLSSSNALAVLPLAAVNGSIGTGSVVVGCTAGNCAGAASPAMIRTGSGSIDIAAAADVVLGNSSDVIYTAGIASPGVLFSARGQLQGLLYPTQGGDISISAGRDVQGTAPGNTPSTDLVTNWLWRVGSVGQGGVAGKATAWTVNFADFDQGVAALGGGNVSVRADRDISDLSVSVPTIGRQVGGTTAQNNNVQIINQGDISMHAGNNIGGGSLYEGAGSAVVVAGNQITASPTTPNLYPMILLGDATVSLSAGNGATIAGVGNPTLLPQGAAQNSDANGNRSYFSTYGANSAVSLSTTTGMAELVNDITSTGALIANYTQFALDGNNSNSQDLGGFSSLRIYPGTLSVASLRGGLTIDNSLTLFPEPNGSVNLLAHDTVQFGLGLSTTGFELIESNSDPALLPTPQAPQQSYDYTSNQLNSILAKNIFLNVNQNAAVPVHLTGDTPDSNLSRVVSLTGDVSLESTFSQVYFAAPARVVAGLDVANLSVDFTNLKPSDVSAIIAGRDIIDPTSRNSQGGVNAATSFVDVDGPGSLVLLAGRDISLGTSGGVTSRGNIQNPTLSPVGAGITVEAGIGAPSTQNFATFITDYLSNSSLYTADLIAYMQPYLGGTPSAADALGAFQALSPVEQTPLIDTIFFSELRASGRTAAPLGPHHNDFSRGYAAIEALFPGGNADPSKNQVNPYAGDLSLFFSRIYTLDGGDINLLVPGGLINAGLATPPSSFGVNKQPSDLGIVAQSTGSVNSYSYGSLQVNQSRVFAADGGDILVWATRGDIDAGRGAKTAISAPPPTITIDPVTGAPTVTFPAALIGSGIQTLATSQGVSPGDVDLYAPNGVVNANDAGIVAGNLTIAATAVLGASNIKVSGVSVGVPVEASGLGASLAGASAVGNSAAQSATESVSDSAKRTNAAPIAEAAIGWLDVFVEGFGSEVCKPTDVDCLKRQATH